ncbi:MULTISPECIES: UDP-galactopyranose mutase [unclassified Brevundimonas]|uniref:UDP-galactopyranose mutase n=1 Tax=unclassified Brevundimonas TaxID=2622653 RepID=UPI0025BC8086|nr:MULTISPECIES: UDP-galactopyranose mutase [unclassified Brevundimonas]
MTQSPAAIADVLDLPHARRDPVVCLSHLRWDFVFQRPQHLMARFARTRPVVFFEEPLPSEPGAPVALDVRACPDTGVLVATPRLPHGIEGACRDAVVRQLLDGLLEEQAVSRPVLWYYTPMMLPAARHIEAAAVVFDCMDELSAFRFAPPELRTLEAELMNAADVVFTGGYSLFEAKRNRHANIHPFPSSVDAGHFARARSAAADHPAQAGLPGPRLGFYGVIDERMDLALIAAVADARPDWSLVFVGPVVKIDEKDLPRRPNIHYLGQQSYAELPAFLGGWDVALMPFAIDESTRFISPTKTPEYLAGGRPVVSTPVTDVVRHYGELAGVHIAAGAEAFIAACDAALSQKTADDWLAEADAALRNLSWDQTQARMAVMVDHAAAIGDVPEGGARPGVAQTDLTPSTASPSIRPSARASHYDVLVAGAGFAGAVLAERLAASGRRVLVVDRRPHVGGNAFDEHDAAGVLVHRYGPHIFHTNSAEVFDYLSRFTPWRPYEHRVLARVGDQLVPMPINRTTLNLLYGLDLRSDEQAEAYLSSRAEPVDKVATSEDVVVSAIGRELYETFFRGYTRKQWGLDPSQLDRSVTARVPTRTSTDDRYFTDAFQAMPLHGYTRMFENMLDHPNIRVETGVDFRDVQAEVLYDHLVFTGPIDEFFDHRYGPLPYRSLAFRHETFDQATFQPAAVVNYPDEAVPYTRVTEYKHLTGQSHPRTSVSYEYPCDEGDPYYPVPRPENQALFKQYEALALARPDVSFVGRLATYRYYNMDQVTGQALATFRRLSRTFAAAGATAAPGIRA